MTIEIVQKEHPELFKSQHFVHFLTKDNKEVFQVSGIVLIHYTGMILEWHHEQLALYIELPQELFPLADKVNGKLEVYSIDHWLPFISLNAVEAQNILFNQPAWSGWAVDEFGAEIRPLYIFDRTIKLTATMGTKGVGVQLLRLGYFLTLTGCWKTVSYNPAN
jgi:hypothetical protein